MQIPADILRQCWILTGPTATGKTEISLCLAEMLNVEIVALDSMTVYRRMDVGTAKPTLEERARVPHHLIDILEPHEDFSLAEYLKSAETACRTILARGRVPLFVGGTGLYLRGMLRGVFDGPAADPAIRRRLERLADEEGPQALYDRVQTVDPHTARVLHPRDQRRLIRALEVFESTGVPLSAQQCQTPLPAAARPKHVYWLDPPRAWLHSRINARVEFMFRAGLVEEVRNLLTDPRGLSRTACQALGYKEVIEYIKLGTPLAEVMTLVQARTRQLAKRQHTWFRHLEECVAVPISGDESTEEIAKALAGKRQTHPNGASLV